MDEPPTTSAAPATGDPSTVPPALAGRITREQAEALLDSWHHPRGGRWLDYQVERGELTLTGEPPTMDGAALWGRLLADECDKLFNQAWCALDQIRSADDQDTVYMIAIDDLPSAVEQAWSLAPELAGEHLGLLRGYREERYQELLRQLGIGTDRELRERIECLEFWEENAELMSDLRRTLYRLVREQLQALAGQPTGDAC